MVSLGDKNESVEACTIVNSEDESLDLVTPDPTMG
jgi:hypothetical protein